MNVKSIRLFLPLASSLLCLQAASAQSGTVTAGGTSTPAPFPFGTNGPPSTDPNTRVNYSGEFQQIYDASAFTSPVVISQISFSSADASTGNVAETASYNFTITLANTTASVTDTTSSFVSTTGGTTVYSGTLTANLLANNTFDLNIPLMMPFTYMPGAQNLLLDVVINSATSTNADGTSETDLFQAGDAPVRTIFHSDGGNPNSPTNTAQTGLLTQFTTTPAPAPEPSSVLSLLVGMGGVAMACGLKAAKRRASAAQ